MPCVDVAGLRVAYERAGTGPPVVLLPGIVGEARATWRGQLADLSDAFTVIAWDAPGSGESADPPESFRLHDFADCLARFLDALGVSAAHVVGFSFGGTLALEFCRRHRARLRTLTVLGSYPGWAGSLAPGGVAERLDRSLVESAMSPRQLAETLVPTMFSARFRETAHAEVRWFAAAIERFHPRGYRAMARSLAEASFRDDLAGIAVPTLLVYGDQDARVPHHVGERLRKAIPGSQLVVLPGCGHVSPVESAARVCAEISAFLGRPA